MPGRKIIQIAGATSGDNGNFHSTLFALCSDGTAWRCSLGTPWQRIPDIPGDTIDAETPPQPPAHRAEWPKWAGQKP